MNPSTTETYCVPGEKQRVEACTSRKTRYSQVFQSTSRHGVWLGQDCCLQLPSRTSKWAEIPAICNTASVLLVKMQPQNYEIWHWCSSSANSQRSPLGKNLIFDYEGTLRHFHGSLIQSGLDLKALNRNKPGIQRNRLDLVTAFLMLTF